MAETKISWSEYVWNPLAGCSLKSHGCTNCYAMRQAHRMASNPNVVIRERYEGTTKIGANGSPIWTGRINLVPGVLDVPLRRGKPTVYFVNSMSDLFHEDVPDHYIDRVFGVMCAGSWHKFQILTKRADRLAAYFADMGAVRRRWVEALQRIRDTNASVGSTLDRLSRSIRRIGWPVLNPEIDPSPIPSHIWLGVSCENQETADGRIPHLLKVPAAVRFLSCEPLLGPINLARAVPCGYYCDESVGHIDHQFAPESPGHGSGIGWVIAGSESGPKARPMDEDWVRSLRDQCHRAGVAFFYKQRLESGKVIGLPELDGRRWAEFPESRAVCDHDPVTGRFRSS
jgi:protein gp37